MIRQKYVDASRHPHTFHDMSKPTTKRPHLCRMCLKPIKPKSPVIWTHTITVTGWKPIWLHPKCAH